VYKRQALDKAAEHGILHRRNVSRRKSRLMRSAAKEMCIRDSSSSFQLAFTAQLQVDLSGVTGLTGAASGDLSLAQAEINSARFSGVIQVQSQKQFELSFTLSLSLIHI